MPQYETLIYDKADNGVVTITLNRPDRMNTLGGTMKPDLYDAFQNQMLNDRDVRCVILTGSGERAFCAGADIKERAANRPPAAEYYAKQKFTHDLTRLIEEFERPVIVAINGVCLGGGMEIALCGDIRIAADHAKLGLPEVKLGVLPGAGGTQRMPRLIGGPKAKELMFTGRHITAQEALDYGIVNRVVPMADLMATARELADEIAAQPPLSVAFIKQAINKGMQVGIEEGLEYERLAASMIVDSEDRKEGMAAFLEKRKPVFKGR
ncbi:crotonase [Oceanicola sp. 22II-s10i]|uniref:enoyl-CoA hydratase/isomerase family protein n=1 Tax=Oceanicola sp. 22II-s10i TaxID=1317116 RepID=UPI000B5252AE|nr:enoyl-CoA hydratase-related protein [Oceanicola sp. 22II-s10i]OWU86650.1 crotonase [Oceanicola sp. 22II-s10i]